MKYQANEQFVHVSEIIVNSGTQEKNIMKLRTDAYCSSFSFLKMKTSESFMLHSIDDSIN